MTNPLSRTYRLSLPRLVICLVVYLLLVLTACTVLLILWDRPRPSLPLRTRPAPLGRGVPTA